MEEAFEDKVINFLCRIHPLRRRECRDMLLKNLPPEPLLHMSRYDDMLPDLNQIVMSAKEWGCILSNGNFALDIVIVNTLPFVRGTQLESELNALRKEFDSQANREKNFIDPPFVAREADPKPLVVDKKPEHQQKKEQDNNLNINDIDALVERAQLFQISAKNVKQVKQALDSISSVIKAKNDLESENREREAREPDKKHRKKVLARKKKMELLEKDIKLPLQKIKQFFDGEPIERNVFINICSQLKLEWQKILDIDFCRVLVEVVPPIRSQFYKKIQGICGTLRILDVAQPIDLDDLYVDVNILDAPISYIHLEPSDLPEIYNPKTDEFNRWGLGKVRQARVPGLEAVTQHSKLMVLGKPGSGKSTFLQHLAIQCNQGEFQAERVPIFIRLKNFADDASSKGNFSLLNYISQEFESCIFVEPSVIEKVFKYGRALILLDGLDEVSEEDSGKVINAIRTFCENYYQNQFIITCRIAAHESRFSNFTDVEIADFNQEQIEDFAKNWFIAVDRNSEAEGQEKTAQFIKKLNRSKNQQIREIAVTPILLSLTCLVFQAQGKFPSNRSKLYDKGLEILLRKWDEFRHIERDEVYQNLSIGHKKKLLTQIAAITFENNRYFFEQGEIQQRIADYLCTLSNAQINPVKLQQDSEVVLKSIEAQHGLLVERARGIYSFSHLTFHEYFTARAFITNFEPQTSEISISGITKKKWHEVFLLASGMMQNADDLLRSMKKKIDGLLVDDKSLQQLLIWINQQPNSRRIPLRRAAVRAGYFITGFEYEFGKYSTEMQEIIKLGNLLVDSLNIQDQYSYPIDDDVLDIFTYSPYQNEYKLKNNSIKVSRSSINHINHDEILFFLKLSPTEISNYVVSITIHFVNALDHIDKIINQAEGKIRNILRNYTRYSPADNELLLGNSFNSERIIKYICQHMCKSQQIIEELREQFNFNMYGDRTKIKNWWEVNGQSCIKKLRNVVINYLKINHNLQFNTQQRELLKQYYQANELLVECMNSASHVSPKVRQEIEDTLLLPIAEIEKRRQQS